MRFAGLLFMLGASACHEVPALHGTPLTCSTDASCPDGLRCYRGGCIANGRPELEPFQVTFVGVNTSVTVPAVVHDAEDDAITVSWTQTAGPALPNLPASGPSLTVQPSDEGTYAFAATATDPYASSTAYLTVVALASPPPAGSPVYVADTSDDAAGCGTISHPCASVAAGLAARPAASSPLIVAASQRAPRYDHCLRLGAGESVWGGFSAAWQFDPALRERTNIVCDLGDVTRDPVWPTGLNATGHVMTDDATVGNLKLSVDAEAYSGDQDVWLMTLLIRGVNDVPRVRDADIEIPACSHCLATGLGADAAAPRLDGVEVMGSTSVFEQPDAAYGMWFSGSAAQVSKVAGRGRVLLNAASQGAAVGIVVSGGSAMIDGMDVVGGLAPLLIGIELVGGSGTVKNTHIDLRSFGTFIMMGLVNSPCELFDCVNVQGPPASTLDNNHITLQGGVGVLGNSPCLAAGIFSATTFENPIDPPVPNALSRNEVTISDQVALSVGVVHFGGGATITGDPSRSTPDILIGPADVSGEGCLAFTNSIFPFFPLGAMGLELLGPVGDSVSGTVIEVGANGSPVAGLYVIAPSSVTVRDNTIDVAEPGGVVADDIAVAAHFVSLSDSAGVESALDRNRLRVHDGARFGVALQFDGFAPWQVTNNFLYGGDTTYSTGVRVDAKASLTDWPQVVHNTIAAGGDPALTLVSRAIAFDRGGSRGASDPSGGGGPAVNSGVWVNNLLDMGEASGQRYVLDDPPGISLNILQKNLVHQEGTRPSPRPAAPLVNVVYGEKRLHWVVPTSGSLLTVRGNIKSGAVDPLTDESWQPLGARPTVLWAGGLSPLGTGGVIVAARSDAMGFAEVLPDVADFQWTSTVPTVNTLIVPPVPEGTPALNPTAIAYGNADGQFPDDIVFTSQSGPYRLWLMRGRPAFLGGGFEAPEPLAMTPGLVNPTDIAVGPPDTNGLQQFFIADAGATAPRLRQWPNTLPNLGLGSQAIVALAAGTLYDPFGIFPAERPMLAVVSGTQLRVWRISGAPTWTELSFSGRICNNTANPTALRLAYVACGGGCQQTSLVVGCSDGTLETHLLTGTSQDVLQLGVRNDIPAVAAPVSAIAAFEHAVLVTYQGSNTLGMHDAEQLDVVATYTPLSDVGRRGAVGLYEPVSLIDNPGVIERGNCTLKLRDGSPTPAEPYDLHLVPGTSDACRNTAAPQASMPPEITDKSRLAEDLDATARSVSAPDVGADED